MLDFTTGFVNKKPAPWDRAQNIVKSTGEQDIKTEHPRDTGTSVWDTAMFDIDQFEDES